MLFRSWLRHRYAVPERAIHARLAIRPFLISELATLRRHGMDRKNQDSAVDVGQSNPHRAADRPDPRNRRHRAPATCRRSGNVAAYCAGFLNARAKIASSESFPRFVDRVARTRSRFFTLPCRGRVAHRRCAGGVRGDAGSRSALARCFHPIPPPFGRRPSPSRGRWEQRACSGAGI